MKKVDNTRLDSRKLIGALVMVSLIAVLIRGYMYFENKASALPLKIGSQFPSSTLSTLSHTFIQTDSLITNKCLVVWISTQCPLCRDEIRSLDSIGKMVGDSMKIIVISLNSYKETENFKKANQVSVPIYLANRDDAVLKMVFDHYKIAVMFRDIDSSIEVTDQGAKWIFDFV